MRSTVLVSTDLSVLMRGLTTVGWEAGAAARATGAQAKTKAIIRVTHFMGHSPLARFVEGSRRGRSHDNLWVTRTRSYRLRRGHELVWIFWRGVGLM